MAEGNELKGELTPEERAALEKEIPAFRREEKIKERGKLTRGARGSGISPAGGTASKLNPLDPKDRQWGEPTRPVTPEDITPPSEN